MRSVRLNQIVVTPLVVAASLMLGLTLSFNAAAGLFDDDEARRELKNLRAQTEQQNRDNEARFFKLDESIKILEGAYKSQPAVGIIAEHLGDVYYKKTLTDRALKMYNKALNLETDPKRIEELRQKITSMDRQQMPDRVPANSTATANIKEKAGRH